MGGCFEERGVILNFRHRRSGSPCLSFALGVWTCDLMMVDSVSVSAGEVMSTPDQLIPVDQRYSRVNV